MILAEAIKLYCEAHNISVRKLSDTLGIKNQMVVSHFLNGKSIRSDHFAKLLAWALQPSRPKVDRQQ